ncbi:MAG: tRNA lysidine(34) synthetase TilS, partial [Chloroflexota bacterium]
MLAADANPCAFIEAHTLRLAVQICCFDRVSRRAAVLDARFWFAHTHSPPRLFRSIVRQDEPVTTSDPLHRALLAASLPARAHLLIALSGGADSVALLSTAYQAARGDRPDWTVSAGHVHHGLRGAEADADEQFVGLLCAHLGVALQVQQVDTRDYAARRHVSIQTAARELRYASLEKMRQDLQADFILTAHTAEDQAETVVMRLLRGAGIRGLSGIRARRGKVYRPFLSVRRAEVLAALQETGQGYRLDSTNRESVYLRNRVRQQVIPLLQALEPSIVPALQRTAQTVALDFDYLQSEASIALRALAIRQQSDEIGASLFLWRALHPALRHLTLHSMVTSLAGAEPDHALLRRIEDFLLGDSRSTSLPRQITGALWLRRVAGRFSLTSFPPTTVRFEATSTAVPGEVDTPFGHLRIAILDNDAL